MPPIRSRLSALCAALALLLGVQSAQAAQSAEDPRPSLALMTSLPIIWGEGDIGDTLAGRRQSAQSYRFLETRYRLTVLDVVDGKALGAHPVLMLAQPRALSPHELAAIDTWVRGGGRVLILADPSLHWPSVYPLGDPRAPLAVTLLDPLLDHWGVRVDLTSIGRHAAPVRMNLREGARDWRLSVVAPGAFVATGKDCHVESQGLIARCQLGKGRAVLIADADLLSDPLWGEEGDGNGPAIGALIDGLLGISRDAALGISGDAGISRDSTLKSLIAGKVRFTAIFPILTFLLLCCLAFFIWNRRRN